VIKQVFGHKEYAMCEGLQDPKWIIDCGANIGCASAAFLTRFPKARLFAVEPQSGNFAVLQKNLEQYGDRAIAIQAGIWPREEDLHVERVEGRDGEEWAYQVRPCKRGEEADARGKTIPALMEEFGIERIDLLKIDIEGSERELFATGYEPFLDRTSNLAIELHGGPSARRSFSKPWPSTTMARLRSARLSIAPGSHDAVELWSFEFGLPAVILSEKRLPR